MDHIVQGVTKSRTQLSDFHFHANNERQSILLGIYKNELKMDHRPKYEN